MNPASEYKPALYIVVPALNEEKIIAQTLGRIEAEVGLPHELIVVDDHSTDRTADVVRSFGKRHPNVSVISNEGPNGFGNALKAGYTAAGSGAIVTMMADLCDDPQTIAPMYAKIVEGYDLVCGSRYMPGGGKQDEDSEVKGMFSRFVGLSLRRLVGMPTHDTTNAFKMYRSEVLKSLSMEEAGFACSMEIAIKAFFRGAKITEVPTVWRGRTAGKSKFSLLKGCKGYLRWYAWALLSRQHRFTRGKFSGPFKGASGPEKENK